MQEFTVHTGIVATMDRANVDTDQIIPKQFLKRIERTGFGQYLFYDWRFLDDGTPHPEFELNHPRHEGASILLARENFGCGSSREHAPWALQDYGFRVIIAPSFADIFHNNCFKNGMLPIELPHDVVDELFERWAKHEDHALTICLESKTVQDEHGFHTEFHVHDHHRHCLLHGLDDIGLTLQHEDKIAAFEAARS